MAKVIGGFATSHTPLMHLPGEWWGPYATRDPNNRELILPPAGKRVTYNELVAAADPKIATMINEETFVRRANNIQAALDEVRDRFTQADPDVVVMIGDDQSELLFDDNYPMINVYWGETMRIIPRYPQPDGPAWTKVNWQAYGAEDREYPVDSELGRHLIESLCEDDFDVAHSRYLKESYGGSIGPAGWYLDMKRETEARPFGMAHAYSFPIGRWFGGKSPPIVPVTINTCYPPNWISPRRAFALGQAMRRAIDAWDSDKTVAIVTSGGLSHFVVDEEIDRLALKGLTEGNGELLSSLPRRQLQSATTEILNWVAAAGAMNGEKLDLINYEAGYRTVAGTGCGCACGTWL